MTQEEKSRAILLAEEKVRQAKAGLAKAKREERKKARKDQDHHKFTMSEIDCNCGLECSVFMELGKILNRKGRYLKFLFDFFEPKVRNLRERLLPSRSVELHM